MVFMETFVHAMYNLQCISNTSREVIQPGLNSGFGFRSCLFRFWTHQPIRLNTQFDFKLWYIVECVNIYTDDGSDITTWGNCGWNVHIVHQSVKLGCSKVFYTSEFDIWYINAQNHNHFKHQLWTPFCCVIIYFSCCSISMCCVLFCFCTPIKGLSFCRIFSCH